MTPSQFEVTDHSGTDETLVKFCKIIREVTIPAGYSLAEGEIVAQTEVQLPTYGHGVMSFRTQVDQEPPDANVVALDGPRVGIWEPAGRWPKLDACQQARTVRVETQLSARLMVNHFQNTEPRQIAVTEVRFPKLDPTPCPPAGPGAGAGAFAPTLPLVATLSAWRP